MAPLIKSEGKEDESLKMCIWCYFQSETEERTVLLETKSGISVVRLEVGDFIFDKKYPYNGLPADMWDNVKKGVVQNGLKKLKKLGIIKINRIGIDHSIITVVDFEEYQNKDNLPQWKDS